jgi:hypothetical protein
LEFNLTDASAYIAISITERGRFVGIPLTGSKSLSYKFNVWVMYILSGCICEIEHIYCGRPPTYFATFMNIVKLCSHALCVYYYRDVL